MRNFQDISKVKKINHLNVFGDVQVIGKRRNQKARIQEGKQRGSEDGTRTIGDEKNLIRRKDEEEKSENHGEVGKSKRGERGGE